MKIAFVLTVHRPDDDRVWHQQAQTLIAHGHAVFIISATRFPVSRDGTFCFDYRNLTRRQIIEHFCSFLNKINPDAVICDNPVSILASSKYKRKSKNCHLKIYYDITEYYPAKIHFHHNSKLKNLLKFPFWFALSFYVSLPVSGFIFGEYYKSLPYRIFFWKRKVELSYYADLKQITTFPINADLQKIVLFYAGKLNDDAGFTAVERVAKICAGRFADREFVLRVVSRDVAEKSAKTEGNFTAEYSPLLPFEDFCKTFGSADIFFDLRKLDWENRHSLPIKLFYCMAAGRAVIYSDNQSIRRNVPEISEFGMLVNPQETETIVNIITKYLTNKDLYAKHCARARYLAETKYNWKNIENQFVEFVEKI